jgi:hypothetical protein
MLSEAPKYGLVTVSSTSSKPLCTGTTEAGLVTISFNSTAYFVGSSYVSADGTVAASFSKYDTSTITQVRSVVYAYSAQYTASPLIVQYKEGDFTATSTSVSSPSSKLPESSIHTPDPVRLSTGAKADIGVGAAFGVLALVTIFGVVWYKKHYKCKVVQAPAHDMYTTCEQRVGLPNEQQAELLNVQGAERHTESMPPTELPVHGYGKVNPHDPAELAAH